MMLLSPEKRPDTLHPPQNPKLGIQALQFSVPNYFPSLPIAASVILTTAALCDIHAHMATSRPFLIIFSS